MDKKYDIIVIGSGIGGLTAAGLLARAAGKRVLVLEKHSERGGLTHVFRRDGASWDVGVHYVGNVQPGTLERRIFDFITGGKLKWNKMPDNFERFVYPGLDFAVPSDPKRYAKRLMELFPDEKVAIRRYFKDLRTASRWYVLGLQQQMVPYFLPPLSWILTLLRKFGQKLALQTTQAYLDGHFQSTSLKNLLASQWGDYGVPPAESAFALHSLVVYSYAYGGYFPAGGSGRIGRTIEAVIEAAGGEIRVCNEVEEILLKGGRAVGVKVIDRRGAKPRERTYYAKTIISNAGAILTYQKLLPHGTKVDKKIKRHREFVRNNQGGGSGVTLYIRLKDSPAKLGIQGENYWINMDNNGHNLLDDGSELALQGKPRLIYASFPSLKSGEEHFHTAECIVILNSKAFDKWQGSTLMNRGREYSEVKDKIAKGLIDAVDKTIPGFADLVSYYELSTPLTVEHYTSHPGGRFYGLPGTPAKVKANTSLFKSHTPVRGLFISGTDACSLGVTGAMFGGVAAAASVLWPQGYGFPRIMAAMALLRNRRIKPVRPQSRREAVVKSKTMLTPQVAHLILELDREMDFTPGQYVKLRVAPYEWRDYSIASCSGRNLGLLMSSRTGGEGSKWIEKVQNGEKTEIEAPFGSYALVKNNHRRVFIATGTGLAPFLSMFEAGVGENSQLFFGCRTNDEDITRHFTNLPPVTSCISREKAPQGGFNGRVTAAIADLDFDPAETDFYLCGSAAMVSDSRAILERAGAVNILVEPY